MLFRHRTISRPLHLLIGIFLVTCAVPCSAYPHAIVIDSTPKDGAALTVSPDLVSLRFNARIEKSLTSVALVRSDGRAFPVSIASKSGTGGDEGDLLAVRLPRLGPGSYTIRYTVLAKDGHLTPGVLRFIILKGK